MVGQLTTGKNIQVEHFAVFVVYSWQFIFPYLYETVSMLMVY